MTALGECPALGILRPLTAAQERDPRHVRLIHALNIVNKGAIAALMPGYTLCMVPLRSGLEAQACGEHGETRGLRAPGVGLDVWSVRAPGLGPLYAVLLDGADLRVGAGGLMRLTPPPTTAGRQRVR